MSGDLTGTGGFSFNAPNGATNIDFPSTCLSTILNCNPLSENGFPHITGAQRADYVVADQQLTGALFSYVVDHDDQGCNQDPTDDFWIEVKDKDGNVVLEVNGPDSNPAGEDGEDGDDEAIQCGNIIVPHNAGGGGKGKK